MNTRDIEAFLAVVDAGSIMGAAATLHLTQPAVTRRVHGTLGARPVSSRNHFRLRKAYPKLTLRITTAWSPALLEQIPSNRIDAALVHLPEHAPASPLLGIDPVSTQRMIVTAAKSLGLRGRRSLADLAERPWILSQDGCGYREVLRQALARANAPFVAAVETYNSELRMSLVARGLGLGVSTETALDRSKYRNQLDVLDLRDFKPQIHIGLAHRAACGRLAGPLGLLAGALKSAQKPASVVRLRTAARAS